MRVVIEAMVNGRPEEVCFRHAIQVALQGQAVTLIADADAGRPTCPGCTAEHDAKSEQRQSVVRRVVNGSKG